MVPPVQAYTAEDVWNATELVSDQFISRLARCSKVLSSQPPLVAAIEERAASMRAP